MLKIRKYLAIFSVLFVIGCSSLSVSVDYDPNVDISSYESFSIVHQGVDTLTIDRINNAIKNELTKRNYKFVDVDKSSFVVMYNYGSQEKTDITTDYRRVGFSRYGGAVVATTSEYNYVEGKMNIRVIDTKTKKVIWSSLGTNILEKQNTPQKRTNYINKIIEGMLEKFPKRKM